MEVFILRIQEALDKGNDREAIRRCVHAVMRNRVPEDEECRIVRERVIEIVEKNGLRERILDDLEDRHTRGEYILFGPIYELYKFEAWAFEEISIRTLEGLYAFYDQSGERMTPVALSESLLDRYREEGNQDMIDMAQKRVERNIQILREKAAHYQDTGEHRFAFNSYRCLLETDFDCYEYHLGYLFNAIKSGKPEEAYKELLKNKAHRDYVIADETLKNYFYDLSLLVSTDDERPKFDELH